MNSSVDRHCDTLDLIRALAAAAVCVSHIRNLMFVDYGASAGIGLVGKAFYFASNYGHSAVIVFFVLSGYFVGGSVLRQVEAGTWSWKRYLLERLSRLWIVLIPALVLTLFWDRMGLSFASGPFYLGTEGNFDQQINVAQHLGVGTLACNAAFLQTLACGTYGSNGPLWSLANEFWYYLWFPACFVLIARRRGAASLVTCALAVGTMILFPSLIGGFGIWLFGVLLAWMEKRMPRAVMQRRVPWRTIASAFAFVATLVAIRWLASGNDWLVGIVCALFVGSVLRERVTLRPAALSRVSVSLSAFSYSLYLTHFPFVLFFAAVVFRHRIQFDGYGMAVFAGMLALCYAYAYGVYWLFERNTKRLQRALRNVRVMRVKAGAMNRV